MYTMDFDTEKYNMYQFACFVFCIVLMQTAGINSDNAEESDESGSTEEFFTLRKECLKEFDMTEEDLNAVFMSTDADLSKINPCYWGCYFKKVGLLNEKGQYDLDNYMNELKSLKDKDRIAELYELGKRCESVKDKAVTDGEAGCERGALLAACLLSYDEKTE